MANEDISFTRERARSWGCWGERGGKTTPRSRCHLVAPHPPALLRRPGVSPGGACAGCCGRTTRPSGGGPGGPPTAGTLERFAGDGRVMVFFKTPSRARPRLAAVRMATAMRAAHARTWRPAGAGVGHELGPRGGHRHRGVRARWAASASRPLRLRLRGPGDQPGARLWRRPLMARSDQPARPGDRGSGGDGARAGGGARPGPGRCGAFSVLRPSTASWPHRTGR